MPISFLKLSPEYTIGQAAGGGVVAYILQLGDPGYDTNTQHGLIAATSDQSTGIQWGCFGAGLISGCAGTVLGTGLANTNAILVGCATRPIAASITGNGTNINGYTDWYLPSKDELNKLYLNRTIIGNFASTFYWSSSLFSNSVAYYQNFADGSSNTNFTYSTFRVRAIRSY